MSYKYQRGKSYVSRNQDEIDRLTKQYTERGDFSYSPERDQAFKDYAKMMRDQGSLAMQDTIGKATASTGGYGNSYAQTAGQQVYNDYLNEIGAAESSFYDRAFDRFNAEGNNILAKRSVLQEQEAADQAAWNAAYAEDNYAGKEMSDEDWAGYLTALQNANGADDILKADEYLQMMHNNGYDITDADSKIMQWINNNELSGEQILGEDGKTYTYTNTNRSYSDLGAVNGIGNTKEGQNFHISREGKNYNLEVGKEVAGNAALTRRAEEAMDTEVIRYGNKLYLLYNGKVYTIKNTKDYSTLLDM